MNLPNPPEQDVEQEREPEPEPVPDDAQPENWIRKTLETLHWRFHATFPNTISSPHRDDQVYFERQSREKNETTRIPESEELRCAAVWGVEVFGPAEIEAFYRQLIKLNWHKPQPHIIRKGVVETIRGWRAYGITGRFNIGLVKLRHEQGFQRTYLGPVPKEIKELDVRIVQFTPEITCMVVGFVLTEQSSKAYEAELQKDRKYEHRADFGKFFYTTWGVEHLKRESVDAQRLKFKGIVELWFKKNFPGFFYSSSGGRRLPTVELVTCKHTPILAYPHEQSTREEWSNLLIPDGWGDIFHDTNNPKFRYRRSEPGDDMPFHSIVALETSSLAEHEFEIYGGITSGAIVRFVNEGMEDFLCQTAGLHILHEIERILKKSREKIKTGGSSYTEIINSVSEIKYFFDHSIGFSAILTGLQSKSNVEWQYKWSENEFLSKPWPEGRSPIKISESMRLYTNRLSERVIKDEAATREHLEQLVSILSTRESVKTQRRMEHLTYLTIVLAVGSLAISLTPDAFLGIKANIANIFLKK